MIKKFKTVVDKYGFNHHEINISINLVSVYFSVAKSSFRGPYSDYRKNLSQQNDFIGMIHTVKGKGRIVTTDNEFSVSENTVLFVHFHNCVSFIADSNEWHYYTVWFRVNGLKIDLNKIHRVPLLPKEESVVDEIVNLLDTNDYINCCKANTLAQRLILDIHSLIMGEENAQNPYAEVMNKVVAYISANLNGNIQVSDLSALCNFSKNHFFKIFKQVFNTSPQQYIRREKLKKAAFLLLNTAMPIAEIADELSFDSPAHFSSCFKKAYDMSPREFRHQK